MTRGLGIAAVILVAVVGFFALRGGTDTYSAKVLLDNAGGLRTGSPVVVGGVVVGKVQLDIDQKTDKVLVEMEVDPRYAPFGKGATAEIIAQNLLGQKQLSVEPGNLDEPQPSGFEIASENVTQQTDLDQVLNVLDAPTRARLAIFINEAGTAFTGRREDFNILLRDAAPAIAGIDNILSAINEDREALGNLVELSDRYVAETTAQREKLVALVDKVGGTATTVAARRAELRETLAQAPGGLRTLRTFLGRLEDATVPLGPAAEKITASAGPLREAQDALPAFIDAATPTLRAAADVAPDLTRLGRRATPVLRKAVPTLRQLRTTAQRDLPGVSSTVDGSIDNTIATLENWSRAIQYRDRLSHIFRGEASFAPNFIDSILGRLQRETQSKRSGRARGGRPGAPRPAAPTAPQQPQQQPGGLVPKAPLLDQLPTKPLSDRLDQTLRDTTQKLLPPRGGQPAPASGLLDFLLGP